MDFGRFFSPQTRDQPNAADTPPRQSQGFWPTVTMVLQAWTEPVEQKSSPPATIGVFGSYVSLSNWRIFDLIHSVLPSAIAHVPHGHTRIPIQFAC